MARATGMTGSSVGRMLSGQTMPDPWRLERLADALSVSLAELLERSGIASPGAVQDGPVGASKRLAPAEAAKRLGITDPLRVALFEAMVATLTDPAVGRDN